MMKIKDVRSAVLSRLYTLYQEKGHDWGAEMEELEEGLDVHAGTVEGVLKDFRNQGLVDFDETLDGLHCPRLTTQGVEDYEDPGSVIAPDVQNIQHITIHAIHGGTNQFAPGGTQNVTYRTVLQAALEVAGERPGVPKPVEAAIRLLWEYPDVETLLAEAEKRVRK